MVLGKSSILFYFFFECGYLFFPEPFVERTVLPMDGSGLLVKDRLTTYAWVYLWAAHSTPQICIPVMMIPAPHSVGYCGFEIGNVSPTALFFSSKMVSATWASFEISCELQDGFSISTRKKKRIWHFDRGCTKSVELFVTLTF